MILFPRKWFQEKTDNLISRTLHTATVVLSLQKISFSQFLSRVSILTRDIDIANLFVCLSVRLSVRNVPVSDENGLTYRHVYFTKRYPNHSSFASIKHLHEIPTGSRGREIQVGYKKFAIFYQ